MGNDRSVRRRSSSTYHTRARQSLSQQRDAIRILQGLELKSYRMTSYAKIVGVRSSRALRPRGSEEVTTKQRLSVPVYSCRRHACNAAFYVNLT